MKIGLTGGLGTGKSTVLRLFAARGAVVLDADSLAHRAIEPGQEAYKKTLRTFGKEVLHADRSIDRAKLAKIVFGNAAKLTKLTRIVHPPVKQEIKEFLRRCKGPVKLCVVSIPLLYETRMEKYFDAVIAVKVRQQEVLKRVAKSRGMRRADMLRRIQAQMPAAEKCRRADFVLDNNGSLEYLRKQVRDLLQKIKLGEV